MIEIRKHPLGYAVYYAGTILLIGTAAECRTAAAKYAKQWGVDVQRLKGGA